MCRFLLLYFKVSMCKISDKSDKFLLHNLAIYLSVHVFLDTAKFVIEQNKYRVGQKNWTIFKSV